MTPRYAIASDTGRERANNEDRVFADATRGLFLIADGMGGHAAGEKAAETAVQMIAQHFDEAGRDAEQRVRSAITAANNRIFQLSQENEEWRGMACVLTLAVVDDGRLTFGHVGDSRLYLVWNGTVKKLTSDHSPVGEQEDQGELTELQAMAHPRRNEVFRDVGTRLHEPGDEDFIELRSLPFHNEAAILLCSDGLSDVLTSVQIGGIVDSFDGDSERIARMLVDAANAAGGKDNISVIFVAGPEFLGSASLVMSAARARHAVTRMRVAAGTWSAWGKAWLGRVAWFVAGMMVGAIAWAVIQHVRHV